jgi:ABC superfamily ATP binding cassette transporter, integral membrane transport protein
MTLLLGLSFVVSFLTWAGAGRSSVVPLVTILSSTLALSVPLVFGGLAGVVGERSGTINIAIEGQLLGGAFLAAVVASASGSPWAGLLAAPPAGILVALLLALFGLKYRVNQIVVGVVLNVLVSGLTGFLFSTVLSDSGSLNRAMRLPRLPVPGLSHVPVLGPVLFNQTILVYAMYAAVGILSLMLFRSRWGLRMRAVGEHPRAADTVGIAVMRTRVNNLVLGGALAGLGGAFFTVGSGLSFTKGISAGNGYIALAAMILGAWNPLGTLWAALLFGFATSVGQTLSVIGSPIPTNFILMIPYVVTILAVAGFVGRVRPPAAEGVPYP